MTNDGLDTDTPISASIHLVLDPHLSLAVTGKFGSLIYVRKSVIQILNGMNGKAQFFRGYALPTVGIFS